MNFHAATGAFKDYTCDGVIVSIDSDGQLDQLGKEVDAALDGWLTRLIDRDSIVGTADDSWVFAAPGEGPLETIVLVGIGDRETVDAGIAFRAGGAGLRLISSRQHQQVLIGIASHWTAEVARASVAGGDAASAGQDLYRSDRKETVPVDVHWLGVEKGVLNAGIGIGDGIRIAKRLVDEPPNKIYPASFAAEAEKLGEECGFSVEIWDHHRLKSENCEAILAVGAGSTHEPRLLIFRHEGGPTDEAPIAIVGKGVTFDSGGLSIKPSDSMKEMKCDMAGAATVLGTMAAVSRLGIQKNVIGLVGLAENMLSGSSYKLGDVIRSRNGKTIEILNTDAEGRVVLADTLDVAVEQEPSNIVDLATLTGACLVALGMDVAGIMSNNDAWCSEVRRAAELEDEKVWELPMWDFYDSQIKSKVADIKNVGEGRWGGAITAAKFLEEFVGEIPWVHIDIAGPAFSDSAKPWRDAGGTGTMVRTLVRLIESM